MISLTTVLQKTNSYLSLCYKKQTNKTVLLIVLALSSLSSLNFLKFTEDKSSVFVIGLCLALSNRPSIFQICQGILSKKNIVQLCIYQLEKLPKIRSFLSSNDLHAFIYSHLDYCSASYATAFLFWLVQIQTGTKICQHITPVLANSHWLAVKFWKCCPNYTNDF